MVLTESDRFVQVLFRGASPAPAAAPGEPIPEPEWLHNPRYGVAAKAASVVTQKDAIAQQAARWHDSATRLLDELAIEIWGAEGVGLRATGAVVERTTSPRSYRWEARSAVRTGPYGSLVLERLAVEAHFSGTQIEWRVPGTDLRSLLLVDLLRQLAVLGPELLEVGAA